MKDNLVVVRAGVNSLHPEWVKEVNSTNFDIVVTFYGEVIPEKWTGKGYEIIPIKGSKWRGLYAFFKKTDSWKLYERIFLPDDDLLISSSMLDKFFNLASKLKADLCQPALDDKSHFSHLITLSSSSFDYRITDFVEVMCPCFSREFLELSLELFNESNSGWGMDCYWYMLLERHNLMPPMILDQMTLTHTRPVGAAGHGGADNPKSEQNAFLAKYKVNHPKLITKAGLLKSGKLLSISESKEKLQIALIKDMFTRNMKIDSSRVLVEAEKIALM